MDQVRIHPDHTAARVARRYGLFGRDVWKVKLTLPDGAFFRVQGDRDMSEGRGGFHRVGDFLDYWMAYEAARSKGAQGSWGYITVMVPEFEVNKAIGLDRQQVVLSESLTYQPRSLDHYIEFMEPSHRVNLS